MTRVYGKHRIISSGKKKIILQGKTVFLNTESPILADGSIPMLPVIIEASSDNISPNKLLVTIVSNCSKTYHIILILKLFTVIRDDLLISQNVELCLPYSIE